MIKAIWITAIVVAAGLLIFSVVEAVKGKKK